MDIEEQKVLDFSDDFEDADKVESNFHKFVNVNDSITGYLRGIETNKIDGKDATNFLLETEKGLIHVGGYSALNSKLKNDSIGKKIKIVYLGEKKAQKGGRMYKEFDVFMK